MSSEDLEDSHGSIKDLDDFHWSKLINSTVYDTKELYSKWAPDYEKDSHLRNDPSHIRDEACLLIPEIERANKRVLDCAAGTGLVGQQLHEVGFRHIDALDACPEMLQEAKKKNVYASLIEAFIGPQPLPIENDTYDLLVGTGLFVEGYVTPDCLPEMIRVVKSGGLLILAIREERLIESPTFIHMEEIMESNDKWRLLTRKVIPNYHQELSGVLWVYKVL